VDIAGGQKIPAACFQPMGMKLLPDTCALGGLATGVPDHLGADGTLGAVCQRPLGNSHSAGLRQPAVVLAQFFQQMRDQHDIPIVAPFAAANMNHHPLAVDITDLQIG
jgi:hypothetical protein